MARVRDGARLVNDEGMGDPVRPRVGHELCEVVVNMMLAMERVGESNKMPVLAAIDNYSL